MTEEDAVLNIGMTVNPNEVPAAMTTNATAADKATASVNALNAAAASLNATTTKTETDAQMLARSYDEDQAARARLTQATTAAVPAENDLAAANKNVALTADQMTFAEREAAGITATTTDVTVKATAAHQNLYGTIREGRFAMMAMIAELQLMQLAQGQTNVAVQEGIKVLQVSVDVGLMAFMAGATGGIAVAVGLAAALASLAVVAASPGPEIDALNKSLDATAKKEEVAHTLATIMQWTDAEATAALNATKKNLDLADSLDKVAKEREGPNIIDRLAAFYESRDLAALTDDAQKFTDQFTTTADKTGAAYDALHLQAVLAGDAITTSFDKLNSTLSTAAEKTASGELSDLTGIAQDAAKAFLSVASSDQNLAQETSDLTTKIVTEQAALAALEATGKALPGDIAAMTAAIQGWKTELSGLIEATPVKADIKADAQALTAHTNYIQEKARLDRSYREQQNADDFANTAKDLANTQEALRIQRTLREADRADQQKLDDAMFNAQQARSNRLADLAFQETQRAAQDAQQRVSYEISAADQILKTEQDLADQIADISTAEGLKLRNAKTELEAETIEYTAGLDIAKQTQRADASISSTDRTVLREMDALTQREKLQDDAAAHQITVEARTYDQAVANATRAYSEETARANQANQDQLADYTNRVNAQVAAENQQAATQKQHYVDQKADAKTRYDDEVTRIQARDTAVVTGGHVETLATKQFNNLHEHRMTDLQAEIDRRITLSQIPFSGTYQPGQQGQTMPSQYAAMTGTYVPGMQGGGSALDMIQYLLSNPSAWGIPMASGGDVFARQPTMLMIGESGPETATVRRGPSSSGGGQVIHIANLTLPNVTDANSLLAELYDKSFQ